MKLSTLALLACLIAIIGLVTVHAVISPDRADLFASLPWPIRYTGENALE